MSNKKALTIRQKLFVHEYIKSKNGTEAAIKAGYSKKTARFIAAENLTKPNIKAEIERIMTRVEEKAIVDKAYVINALKEGVERCIAHKRVMTYDRSIKRKIQKTTKDENGQEIGIFEFDSAGANKVLELLGKHLHLFSNKVSMRESDDLVERLEEARKRICMG